MTEDSCRDALARFSALQEEQSRILRAIIDNIHGDNSEYLDQIRSLSPELEKASNDLIRATVNHIESSRQSDVIIHSIIPLGSQFKLILSDSDGAQPEIFTYARTISDDRFHPVLLLEMANSSTAYCVKFLSDEETRAWSDLSGTSGLVPCQLARVICSPGNWDNSAVMPLLKTWRQVQASGRLDNMDMLVKWTEQLISTVRAVHERNWLHRDIKPGNLLWSSDLEKVYLSDLGSAVPLNDRKSEFALDFLGTIKFADQAIVERKYEYGGQCHQREFDWSSLLYTVAWLAGSRWTNDCSDRPSIVELCGSYHPCELVRRASIS